MLRRAFYVLACAALALHAEHGHNAYGNSSVDLFSDLNAVRNMLQEYAHDIIGHCDKDSAEYKDAQDKYQGLQTRYDDFVEAVATGLSSGKSASTAIMLAHNAQSAALDFSLLTARLLPTYRSVDTFTRTTPLVFTTSQLFEQNRHERSFQKLIQLFRAQGKLAAWGATQ